MLKFCNVNVEKTRGIKIMGILNEEYRETEDDLLSLLSYEEARTLLPFFVRQIDEEVTGEKMTNNEFKKLQKPEAVNIKRQILTI